MSPLSLARRCGLSAGMALAAGSVAYAASYVMAAATCSNGACAIAHDPWPAVVLLAAPAGWAAWVGSRPAPR